MKKELHPETREVTFKCVCGNEFKALSTSKQDVIQIDTCNACHPFYTGAQGRHKKTGSVEKFNKKYNLN
jgi:large subunit ribosomal protein L31